MVEAGVPYITINYPGGWDTHKNHFTTMRRQVPQLDQGAGVAAAGPARSRPAGQHDRLVLRRVRPRPKVDYQPPWNGGATTTARSFRCWSPVADSKAASCRFFDDKGIEVKDRPVYPVDLLGSIYQLAGIDANAKLPHPLGLEAHVLPTEAEGAKSAGLLTEIM
jgi:hypothetical protein